MSKNFVKQERVEIQKPKPDADAIEDLENGSLRRAVIDGDKTTGAFMAGQVSGLIKELKPVSQILSETWSQAENLLK